MNMICGKCGGPIPKQIGPGGRRKFCPACSPKRIRPERTRTVTPLPLPEGTTGVYAASLAALQTAGVVESVDGQCALLLARRMDAGEDSGAGLASLARAHRECMTAALAAAPQEESPLEKLRRERHWARDGG